MKYGVNIRCGCIGRNSVLRRGQEISWVTLLFLFATHGPGLAASTWTDFTNVNTVRAMAVDPKTDRVLMATWGGFLMYDQQTGDVEVQGRPDGFSSVDLKDVAVDSNGTAALATADRGMDIRYESGTIRNFTDLDGLPSNDMTFVTWHDGDIWAGTTKGAVQLELSGGILKPVNLFFAEPWNLEIRDIAFNGDTTAFATNDGLWLAVGGENFQHFTSQQDSLLDDSVNCLFYDSTGVLYIGTNSGVQRLETGGALEKLSGILTGSSLDANDILRWNGQLWLATEGGVYSYDEEGDQWIARVDGLATSRVLSLLVTTEGYLYAGTYLGGFARRIDDGWAAVTSSGPSTNFMTNVAVDPRGALWASTWKAPRSESALERYDGLNWVSYAESNSGLAYNYESALSIAPDSTVWAGSPWYNSATGRSGLSVLDDAGTPSLGDDHWWRFSSDSSGLSGDAIRTEVVFSGKDAAWVGSWEQFSDFGLRGGLDLLQDYKGEARFRSFVDYLRDEDVSALALDRQGNLWIGYNEAGVDVFILEPVSGTDSLILQVDPDEHFLLSSAVNDLKVGPENHLWIASATGVNEVDFLSNPADRSSYSWRSFTRENTGGGIPDLLVRDIEFQGGQYVWLATPSGVSRYDRINDRWTVFNEGNSGLIDNRVWDISVDEVRNVVWFATEKGISRYSPLADQPPVESSRKIIVFPNPFTPSLGHTRVSMGPFSSQASITVYSLGGREVMKIKGDSEWIEWDTRDSTGKLLPSGVYLLVSSTGGGGAAVGKLAIVR